MPTSYTASYDDWARVGLGDYGDFSDRVTFCNQGEDAFSGFGQWCYAPEEPLSDGSRIIYYGTYTNDNSPGTSHYTYAEVFDADELDAFNASLAEWEDAEEWLPDAREDEPEEDADEDEPEVGDITTTDHQHFYQYGKLVLTISADDDHTRALKAFCEREQFWPDAWFVSDHGNAYRITF